MITAHSAHSGVSTVLGTQREEEEEEDGAGLTHFHSFVCLALQHRRRYPSRFTQCGPGT